MKTTMLSSALLAASLLLSNSAQAEIINPNFDTNAAEFGWDAYVTDGFGGEYAVNPTSNEVFSFDSQSGSATITPTDFYAGGYLYQSFAVEADYSALSLQHDYYASDSSIWGDIVNVGLWTDGDLTHDFLLDGLSFDFSSLVTGTMVELRFGFEDWDFDYLGDYLTVSDIAISRSSNASVSEPASYLIFSSLLVALGFRAKSRRKHNENALTLAS